MRGLCPSLRYKLSLSEQRGCADVCYCPGEPPRASYIHWPSTNFGDRVSVSAGEITEARERRICLCLCLSDPNRSFITLTLKGDPWTLNIDPLGGSRSPPTLWPGFRRSSFATTRLCDRGSASALKQVRLVQSKTGYISAAVITRCWAFFVSFFPSRCNQF